MKINWQIKKIEKSLQSIPKLGSLLRSNYLKEGKFPIIDQGQDFIAGYTNDESLIFNDCLPVVIFGDHTRAIKFVDFPFAAGADGTKILKPTEDFEPKFFYYMLQSIDLGSRGYARHFKLLKESDIPVPPLETQKEIVAKLDEKFAKLSEAKKLRQESLADTEKIISQTLREIFEEGKQKGWKEKTINDVCLKVTDGSHNPPKKEGVGEYIMLSSRNIYDGYITFDHPRYLTKNGFELENRRTDIKIGDVLLTIVGTIGRCTVVDFDEPKFTVQRSVAVLKPNNDLNSFYLSYWLRGPFIQDFLLINARGAAQKGFYLKDIKALKILIPLLADQQKIVIKLDELSEKIKNLHEFQKSQLEDIKLLEKAYLKEAFNGELM